MATEVATHPVQNNRYSIPDKPCAPQVVTARAYEVYRHLYGDSQSLQRLAERGGFGVGELIAFLYAHTFPKSEWRDRSDEAFNGMKL